MRQLDPLYTAVTPLEFWKDNCRLGYSTGFFYQDSHNRYFLITTLHSILDEEEAYIPNRVRFRVHKLTKNGKWIVELGELPLYMDGETRWVTISNADIAAIPLIKPNSEYLITPITAKMIPGETEMNRIGEELFVMGYPHGTFFDKTYNLPIIRKASPASAYGVPFNGNPYFLIDSKLQQGMSGAPVLTVPSSIQQTSQGVKLGSRVTHFVGVHSAGYPRLDLNIVWFPEHLLSLNDLKMQDQEELETKNEGID